MTRVVQAAVRSAGPGPRLTLVGVLGMAVLGVQAQTGPGVGGATAAAPTGPATSDKRAFTLTTGVSINETLTNNVNLSASDPQSELITQIAPTISMRSNAGRVQGTLDYTLTEILYARARSTALQQGLNARGKAEAIENFAYLDAAATISRQNISAVGTQSSDNSLRGSNQTEVRTVNLSPYLIGRLGNFASYTARLGYGTTQTDTDQIGKSTTKSGSVHVGSDGALRSVNWGFDASRDAVDFSTGRPTESENQTASLSWAPDYDWQLSARAGREADNYTSDDTESHKTWGGGLRWVPSPRTSLSAQFDKHHYGNTWSVGFNYRTARTVWTLNNFRSVVRNAGSTAQSLALTAYDLIYLQLASLYPDPVQRDNQTLIELRNLGIGPNTPVLGGFLSNSIYLQRGQSLSVAYLGLRTSLVLTAQTSTSSRLDNSTTGTDSLANGSEVRQRTVSATLSQRLTPTSSANLTAVQTRSTASATGDQSKLFALNAQWNTRLGTRTDLMLGARHSIASGLGGYTESALLATFTLSF